MDLMEFKDKSGRDVKPGDFIIYGVMSCDSANIRYGKVIRLQLEKTQWNPLNVKLRVQGIGGWSKDKPELQTQSTLAFGDRILVIERHQLPQNVLVLLDQIPAEIAP